MIPGRLRSTPPDDIILAEAYDRLWRNDAIRAAEFSSLRLEFHNGRVAMSGHVSSRQAGRLAAELVGRARGVQAVTNSLVADPDLAAQVSQALADDPRTRLPVLGVGAFQGWIHLSGKVANSAARLAAEQVAASVEGVRGVLALPSASTGQTDEDRRPIQPRVGATVYAQDGKAGRVEQVIINPASRLVSHFVVAGAPNVNWTPVAGRWVAPIEAVAQAVEASVFLTDPISTLISRAKYNEADFIAPHDGWRAPFPYQAAELRWPADLAAVQTAAGTARFYVSSGLAQPVADAQVAA